jgi:hypothetical protein
MTKKKGYEKVNAIDVSDEEYDLGIFMQGYEVFCELD